MKNQSILIALVFTLFATADSQPGSKCGLTDQKDDSWVELKSIDLRDARTAKINALPLLTKQQLIIAAKAFSDFADGSTPLSRRQSECGDLRNGFSQNYSFQRRRFNHL